MHYLSSRSARVRSQGAQRVLAAVAALALGGAAFSAAPARADHCRAYYTVAYGENLFRIGLKYGLRWNYIAEASGIQDSNKIYAGQVLCIPAASSTGGPQLQLLPAGVIPTISIAAVIKDQTVTITTANFPASTRFDVRMGLMGTRGFGGAYVTTVDSGTGGAFSETFIIPAGLRGQRRVAIRLENASGYYSFNWFWNNSTP